LKDKLIEDKFNVQTGVAIYKNIIGDVVAERDGKRLLFQVKTSRDQVLSSLIDYWKLVSVPNISFLYLAIPDELLQDDIVEIVKRVRIGLYKVSDGQVQRVVEAGELREGYLSFGSVGYPGQIFAGQEFEMTYSVSAQEKIALGAKISYLPGGPFFVPEGESDSITIERLMPGKTFTGKFSIGVRDGVEPGLYSLYLKFSGQEKLQVHRFEIEVREKNEAELIRQSVLSAAKELDYALTTNIENALKRIDEGVDSGAIDIRENITGYSIWNEIGGLCLSKGLFQQAELTYRKMLETIDRQEKRIKTPLHRGLAFQNLGLALYSQGKIDEARESIQKALEWDKITYGEEKAKDSLARKTLDRLFGPGTTKDSQPK
jgi:tetratricopeptide (TPR) repeat protein